MPDNAPPAAPTPALAEPGQGAFWLVWNPAGHNPQYRHASEVAALLEAGRLANSNPGHTFFVMQSVQSFVARGLDTRDLRPRADWEIPF